MRYYYNLSKTFWAISIIVSVISFVAIYFCIRDAGVLGLVLSVLIVIIQMCAFGVMPYYIEELEDRYKVRLMFGSIMLPKSQYKVSEISPDAISGSIRTFGSGGLFGYTGYFYNKQMGDYQAFIANSKAPMLLFTKENKKLIVNAPK